MISFYVSLRRVCVHAGLLLASQLMNGAAATVQRVAQNTVYCPPGRTVAFSMTLPEAKGLVRAGFEVLSNKSGIRLLLYAPQEYQKLRDKQINHALAATRYDHDGMIDARVNVGTKLWLVIDNRLEGRSTAEVKVWADFESGTGVVEGEGPQPGRAAALIAGAFGFSGLCILLFGVGLYATNRTISTRRR